MNKPRSLEWILMKAAAILLVVIGIILFGCTAEQKLCGSEKLYVCGEDGVTYTNACYAEEAGVNVDYEGTCTASGASETCVDTDEGKNVLEFGTTSKGSASFNDSCDPTASLVVYEYYCEGNAITSSSITCPAGMECSTGKCVGAQETCTDTDNGQDADEKGTVSADGDNTTDSCYDGNTVREYYCSNGAPKEVLLDCGDGETCEGGECTSTVECTDSDGGYATFDRGTVSDSGEIYTDYCTNSYTLEEYYCSQEGASRYTVDCGAGNSCVNGECTGDSCTDTDDGQDRYEEGEVRKGTDSWTDYCIDSETVKEYYCSGGDVKTTNLGCSSGYECSGGECVQDEHLCTDTDGGVKRNVFGTVHYGSYETDDVCLSVYSLVEQYCDGANGYQQNIDCRDYDELCYDGVCSDAHCSDTDGGKDYDVKGKITTSTDNGFSSSNYDHCVSDRIVKEYFCDGVEMSYADTECGETEVCDDGECVNAQCTDTDGGRDYDVKGTATKGALSKTDACEGSSTLREYFCSDGMLVNAAYSCECSNGRCTAYYR